jgi:hypothetical protein
MIGWRILGYWDILPQWLEPSGMHSLSRVCNYYSPSTAVVTVAITRASLQWKLICSHFEPVDFVQMSLLNTFRKMKRETTRFQFFFLSFLASFPYSIVSVPATFSKHCELSPWSAWLKKNPSLQNNNTESDVILESFFVSLSSVWT